MNQPQYEELLAALVKLAEPNWAEIVSLAISAFGLFLIVFAYCQLRLMRTQAQNALSAHVELMKWNKAALQNEMLYGTPGLGVELEIAQVLQELGLNTYDQIPPDKYKEIFDNPGNWMPVKYFLNHYETLCVAISGNIVDRELAYNLHSNRIVILWKQWGDFCKFIREKLNDQEIYWELEKWAREFSSEMARRKGSESHERVEAERKIAEGKGMQEI
jgi:hypothetical protein